MNEIQKGLEQDARRVKERILMGAKFEKAQKAAAQLSAFIAEHKWTQSSVAKKLGVSAAVVSQFLKGAYKGKTDELTNKVLNLIESIDRQDRRVKNEEFIQTTVAKTIYTHIKQAEAFSVHEGKGCIIIGDGGHGKSHCLRQYAEVNKNTIYVERDDAMNPTTMFNEIADKLGIFASGSLNAITRRIIENIQNRHITVMIDEASGLKVRQINQLRQVIMVKGRTPLILAGNNDLLRTVMQPTTRKGYESLDQFTSRLTSIVNLDDLASDKKDGGLYTPNDVRKLYEYGGIRLTSDGVVALRKICKTPRSGRLRTCSQLIEALHTSGVVKSSGQITADHIISIIDYLNLPVKTRLPLNLVDSSHNEVAEQVAKTA